MPVNLQDEILLKHYKSQGSYLQHNNDVLCILEGDLLKFMEAHLRVEFSTESFESICPRVSPINFLRRIIDKLSKIYQQPVTRTIVNGTDADQEKLELYVKAMQMDAVMNVGNEFFNAFKANLNQVYLNEEGIPKLRAISNDRFVVYSDNRIDQTVPTHVMMPFGQTIKKAQTPADTDYMIDLFKVYSDDEIYILDEEGKRVFNDMNPDGVNPFGVLPFMYANKSRTFLIPPIDSDTFRMSILLPILMSDLNYAVKYQAFSIIWTLNLEGKDLKMNPNSVWSLKQDPGSDQKPEVGQIKPQVDISQVIELITTQLSMWLNSRNIRPGSVSDLSAQNMVSGISKLVDEMDTSDERKKQVEVYKATEEKFWKDLMHKIHPVWLQQGDIDPEFSGSFTPGATVEVNFPEQLPMLRRGQAVTDMANEVNAGFLSRESAMRKLNPEWSESRLQEEIDKIDGMAVVLEEPAEPEVEDDEEVEDQ